MVTAIFPAAGSSRRMGGGVNKNFLELAGEPILIRTLKTFSQVDRINFLIVIVAAHEVETVEKLLRGTEGLKNFAVTIGGSERQYSIANGLKLLPEDAEIILVHDAARPLVDVSTIDAVIEAAEKFGGAIAAVPEKNTMMAIRTKPEVKERFDALRSFFGFSQSDFFERMLIITEEQARKEGWKG